MKLSIVDTHAHLDMPHFDKDREEVITRALDSGVSMIVTVGIDLKSSQKATELAASHQGVFAAVGFHPHDAAGVKETDIAAIARMAQHPKVVAIGEMGLDFYRNRSPREAQLRTLKWQLELAMDLDRPVVIHCRQADRDMLPLLHDWTSAHKRPDGKPAGVIHCFSGDTDTARQYLDMGFYVALGAYIGYHTSFHLRSVIKSLPSDRILVETDCPFLPPQTHRGKRNEPAYLPLTVKLIAEIRGVSPEVLAGETTRNAIELFGLDSE